MASAEETEKSKVDDLRVESLQLSTSTPTSRTAAPELNHADAQMREYLLQNSSCFVCVDELRQRVSPFSPRPHLNPLSSLRSRVNVKPESL